MVQRRGLPAVRRRQVHTFKDLISGLLEALRTCDYYVLINLARERIIDDGAKCRGSLFSHQELAMALAFDYDHLLILNQSNVHNEGLQGVLVSNIPHFESAEDVLPLVKLAVRDAHWSPQYSRQLQIGRLRWEQKPIRYADHTGVRDQRVLFGDLHNKRTDRAAYRAIARLVSLQETSGPSIDHLDKTLLKATGVQGYEHTIWPVSHEAFDLLALSSCHPNEVYLHSSLDLPVRVPILDRPGTYLLNYQFIAEAFPVLSVVLRWQHTGTRQPKQPEVVDIRIGSHSGPFDPTEPLE